MKVFVVMSNDYPDAVFAEKSAAEAYVKAEMTNPKNRHERSDVPRIYYRAYEFELRQ